MKKISTINEKRVDRRTFCTTAAGGAAALWLGQRSEAAEPNAFKLRYVLASCMYGTTALSEIIPEVKSAGTKYIDIWPRVHGNQREQIKKMGDEAFARLLEKHQAKLGMLTHYDLGPTRLQEDLDFAKKFGVRLMICGGGGPKNLKGAELKSAVKKFVERMKPHVAALAPHGITIGVENHASSLIDSPDSLRWLVEFSNSKHLGIALAPYHLPNNAKLLAQLIEDLDERLVHFYAWQHGMGCHKKLPKEQELLQMPGRGDLDFTPIVAALKKIDYRRWTEVFMHPVPRGIPILETSQKVTSEINRSRKYLESCLEKT